MEKTIKKETLLKVIKKEYKELKRFCALRHDHHGKMMIDSKDAKIWSDVFNSPGSYERYHSESITELDYDWYYSDAEPVQEYLQSAVRTLTAAGWTVI